MRATVGIPIGIFTGLAIHTLGMLERGELSFQWVAGCMVMMAASFALKAIIDEWEERLQRQKDNQESN